MKKKIFYGLLISILLVTGLLIAAEKAVLKVDGSTTVGPIGDAFAEYFKKSYPNVEIAVSKTGSGNGAAALIDGRCDIAMMSRFMKDTEFKNAIAKGVYPVTHTIAMDGVCIIVHPSNPILELKTAQVRDIYNGKITNWNELGGPDLAIVPISRDTSSGTYETFENLVMSGEKIGSKVEYVNANPQAHDRVKSTAGAIGYVGIGFLDSSVKALKIDGVTPSKQTISTGQYPLTRPLFLFTNGYPKLGSIIHKFCTFYLTDTGQQIIEAKGFVPLTNY
jgi:phosphate transport system substrate-binding protein